ncbi:hypothetical protein [Shewanella surugensis]|uniref:Uncharacterized protein n=1 Tax=Shewanella surugensis TaxID=212020 RepID=A0ABT0LE61_9GAMM|nr:hypothetical protein [Shewanella surugensis]MCL1125436.1 hypothetical protein [Shewanella surugensis]
MACNLDEDIEYFLKQQNLKIKDTIESIPFKGCFAQLNNNDISVDTDNKNIIKT